MGEWFWVSFTHCSSWVFVVKTKPPARKQVKDKTQTWYEVVVGNIWGDKSGSLGLIRNTRRVFQRTTAWGNYLQAGIGISRLAIWWFNSVSVLSIAV